MSPVVETLATPSILSSSGTISSKTSLVISLLLTSSCAMAATIIGIISGFSFIITGLEIESSQYAEIWSKLSRISIVTESILAVCSNSKITTETFSLDTDLISLILLVVAIDDSTGEVTTFSTSSGLAPGYVVITIAYGILILGKRSVVIFVNDT